MNTDEIKVQIALGTFFDQISVVDTIKAIDDLEALDIIICHYIDFILSNEFLKSKNIRSSEWARQTYFISVVNEILYNHPLISSNQKKKLKDLLDTAGGSYSTEHTP